MTIMMMMMMMMMTMNSDDGFWGSCTRALVPQAPRGTAHTVVMFVVMMVSLSKSQGG
jgi:hypothetical protein